MNAAKAELDKAPDDAGLKTKFEEAKTAYEAKKAEKEDEDGEVDESKWDEKTKAYIAKLRGESAKHRTKAKELGSKLTQTEAQKKAILKAAGIEDESESPEVKLQAATSEKHALTFRNATLELALENGIAKDDVEYFQFLIEKRAAGLKDDEELSDEQMAGIIADVKKRGGKGAGNTSVGQGKGASGGTGGSPNPEGTNTAVTLDQFCKMNMSEKTKLYGQNADLYNQLMSQAREAKRLV